MPYDPNDPEAKYKNATESLSDAEITRLAQATDASGKFQDLTSTRSRAKSMRSRAEGAGLCRSSQSTAGSIS